jgi:chromosome segregation ATPase
VREFIKHGKDKATIEIELCNTKGKNVVVQRTIQQDNKSQWKLNGTPFRRSLACVRGLAMSNASLARIHCTGHGVGKNRVMEVMKKLNVQVDNLCQFLPQDR